MTKIVLMKTAGGSLVPCDEGARATIASWPVGQGITADFKRARNLLFHRKAFAMLQLAFDSWEPEPRQYLDQVAVKNFDRFRKDLTVMAGFYTTTINLKGEVRLEAESLAFAAMDEDRFSQVYDALVTVVLEKVLTRYRREDLDRVVELMMGFT